MKSFIGSGKLVNHHFVGGQYSDTVQRTVASQGKHTVFFSQSGDVGLSMFSRAFDAPGIGCIWFTP